MIAPTQLQAEIKGSAPLFPMLQGELRRDFDRVATSLDFAPHERLYEYGFPCPYVPFLVSGLIRVFKIGESGREITLFRVHPGQVCILSINFCLMQRQYSAIAEAETPSVAIIVPGREFRRMWGRYPEMQDFVFRVMSERLVDILSVVDEVAFQPIDLRVADRLLHDTRPPRGPVVTTTHAQLAIELGTSREVISRKLKDLERSGVVRLARGRVELLDRAALEFARHELGAHPA